MDKKHINSRSDYENLSNTYKYISIVNKLNLQEVVYSVVIDTEIFYLDKI